MKIELTMIDLTQLFRIKPSEFVISLHPKVLIKKSFDKKLNDSTSLQMIMKIYFNFPDFLLSPRAV